MELWRTLMGYLDVTVETEIDESAEDANRVVFNYTVSNSSSHEADQPLIQFDDVVLRVGVPPDWTTKSIGTPPPGESATFQYRCRYSDLPDIEHDIDGTVSPEAFFQVRRSGKGPGAPHTIEIPLEAYVGLFEDLEPHRWLNSTLREFQVPGQDTTLGELTDMGVPLARIHRRTSLGTALEEASGCSSESGIMVLEQKPARKQGAPNRCCHRTNPTVSASSLTTIAWWPMPACSCRPP